MWQRIQTVWLLIATVLMAVFPWQDLVIFSNIGGDLHAVLTAWGLDTKNSLDHYMLGLYVVGALSLISSFVSLLTIFLFKKRFLQMRLCVFNALLILALSLFLAVQVYFRYQSGHQELAPSFYLAFPCVSFVLQLMARHGVVKDETLIRMSNRLR